MTARSSHCDCENCAVIDRAYRKKVCVCVLLCKAPAGAMTRFEVPDPELRNISYFNSMTSSLIDRRVRHPYIYAFR